MAKKKQENKDVCGGCTHSAYVYEEWNMSIPDKEGVRHPIAIRCELDRICHIKKETACGNYKEKIR